MKIVFIVYHDLKIEARSKETLDALKMIGDVSLVSFAKPSDTENIDIHMSIYSKYLPGIRYLLFLFKARKVIAMKKPEMVVLHDCSPLIPYVKKYHPETTIVYDQSEIYIDRKPQTIKKKILQMIDTKYDKYIRDSHITISANEERAKIMKDYYKLNHSPIVFDNMHRIEDTFNSEICKRKYDQFFDSTCFNVVYAGGIQERRKTYDLIEAIGELGPNYRLIIAGASPEGLKRFNNIIESRGYNNVWYVGFIPRNEWRYLLTKADVSVVAFAMDIVNNIYCASGKMYESLFEGVPILTSENPPLKRICSDYNVGISNNNFKKGIIELESNYDYYKKNALEFSKSVDYDSRIPNLSNEIYSKHANMKGN